MNAPAQNNKPTLPSGSQRMKTVAVFGAAYAGTRAAVLLANGLPAGWRVVVVDRNSHANHVYILPRLAVLPGHEHKAFVPYDRIFRPLPSSDESAPPPPTSPHNITIQATLTSLTPQSATLTHPDGSVSTLEYDYCIYALGSRLPDPTNLWSAAGPAGSSSDELELQNRNKYTGTKTQGISWLQCSQEQIAKARSVLVVGGGALGIQFATDIASVHPSTRVVLLHSRKVLLPRFDSAMGAEVLSTLESLNVETILGERLQPQEKEERNIRGERVVRTSSGREISADLILLCTGQYPNTAPLLGMDARTVGKDNGGLARVLRSMQLGLYEDDSSAADDTPTIARDVEIEVTSAVDSTSSSSSFPEIDSNSNSSCVDGEGQDRVYLGVPSGETTAVGSVVDLDLGDPKDISPLKKEQEEEHTAVHAIEDLAPSDRALVEHVVEELNTELNVHCTLDIDLDVKHEEEEQVTREVPIVFDESVDESESESESVEEVEEEEEEEDIYAGVPKTTPYPHMFVAGDAADAFGALKAGHVAYFQAEVAARNVMRLVARDERLSANAHGEEQEEEMEPLEEYAPCPPAIKVSLGMTKSVYQINGVVGTKDDGVPDLNAAGIWSYFGYPEVGKDGGEEGMFA